MNAFKQLFRPLKGPVLLLKDVGTELVDPPTTIATVTVSGIGYMNTHFMQNFVSFNNTHV